MTVAQITSELEKLAPLPLAETFDNVGLLVGNSDMEVTGVLVTLDTLETVIDEACAKNCNLVVSFHPIIFKGLRHLNNSDYVTRTVTEAVKKNIAIYSMHTALDNVPGGVSGKLAEVLGLKKLKTLIPKEGFIRKLVTYVPESAGAKLLEKLFEAGAGELGNYSHCSFSTLGEGTFLPGTQANPALGTRGNLSREAEKQIHLTFTADREFKILRALHDNHPYEEIAYEITTLNNPYQNLGMGMIGELDSPMAPAAFLSHLKSVLKTPVIRHSELLQNTVNRVAVLGGSGAFAIGAAKSAGADFLVTADLKYHDFFLAEGSLVLADVGHFESEQFTKNLLVDYLTEKFPNFAIRLGETHTNPVKYY
ncbi:Nif3-like dinuclear metal center hexameric protein [Robiginitalea sp.]|nr:Nif3-like dinuclear metal center hexameric protein [Robiginitalea sp.]